MTNNNVQQFLFEQIFSLRYFLKKNHCDGLKKVIDVPQWDLLLLSLNVLMNTKLVSWHRKARKSACWSQITLNLTTTNSKLCTSSKFSRARPPGEFPLSFTFFSLVDFENGLKFTGNATMAL